MIEIHSFIETFKKYISMRMGMFLFFVGIFFIFFEIFPFTHIPTQKNPEPSKEPSIDYQSQKILIETPFSNQMSVAEPVFPDHICSITDYGAKAGGEILNTEAFKKAIEDCAALGGGKVNVPAGIWLTGPIHLKSNIELHIEREATILFSTNLDDYLPVVFSRFEGIEYYNYSPSIYAIDATNVAITGVGTIDGQGPLMWWRMSSDATHAIDTLYSMGDNNVPLSERVFGTKESGLRPAFIECIRCNNVLIQDVKIKDGSMWTIHPVYSKNIIIRGVDIATDPGPSTDGIAIDSSSNVLIENSTLSTGDDAIVLKSGRDKEGMRLHIPTENVVIRNCVVKETHGAIAIGSEMSGDVRNVFVSDINIAKAQYGFRIKATKGRGGIVEDVWVEDMQIRNASIEAIQITTAYGVPFRTDSTTPPLFRNIHLKNISTQKTPQAISVDGLPELPLNNISFENITFATHFGVELSNTENITFKDVNLALKYLIDPLFVITASKDININNTLCNKNRETCLLLKGNKLSGIDIHDSGFGSDKEQVKSSEDVNPEAIIY